jgi:hypothetical protein
MASKLGHLAVVGSPWVRSLVESFEEAAAPSGDPSGTHWEEVRIEGVKPLRAVWAVDGSFVTVRAGGRVPKEVAYVKTALLTVDRDRLDQIDKENPHPLLLQDVLTGSAIFHATVFPLKHVATTMGSNYDAVRHIVFDSLRVDQGGAFFETLKWLVYQKWSATPTKSPSFACPHCDVEHPGLASDGDRGTCPACNEEVLLTDIIGFHLEMDDDSAPESVSSSYMLVMETLMLFTPIRLLWKHADRALLSESLFIKDGPLTLRAQYSKLVPPIRAFLEHAKQEQRPVHIVGQEKTGRFVEHLRSIVDFAPPHERGLAPYFAPLSHDYVRQEVLRAPPRAYAYGVKTNWGEKVFLKIDPGTFMVLNIPTGEYDPAGAFPVAGDLIGVERVLATIPLILSHKHEGALFPIELANGIASLSSYPSAKILERFTEAR